MTKAEQALGKEHNGSIQEPTDLHTGKRISTTEAQAAGLELITDPKQMGALMVTWHIDKCNQAQHVLNLDLCNPDDPQQIGIMVYDPTDPTAREEDGYRQLRMDEVVAFKHGVAYMLDLISDLPFSYTPVDADGKVLPQYASEEELAALEAETDEPTSPANDSGT